MSTRDLVLVGGGHTHALVLRRLAMHPIPGVRVTLVSESGLTPYSGMLPGLIAGHYTPEDIHIDLNRLCRWAGVRFVRGRVGGVDPERRCLRIDGQPELPYDKVSFDTGSTPDLAVPGAREFAIGVKPVSHFFDHWLQLLEAADHSQDAHWGVVGAGAGGVELVLAMAHRLGPSRHVTFHLIYPGERILETYPDPAVVEAEAALERYAVRRHPGFTVAEVTREGLVATDGSTLTLDKTVWCTSAAAPAWPQECGLETANDGFIAVNRFLQSPSHQDVFAAGDVAEMVDDRRPKAGVYAVRQAPVLHENLRRAFLQQPLKPLRLQRAFLSLLSLGEKRALGYRQRMVVKGPWVWRWKNHIDRTFMRKFSELGEPMAMGGSETMEMHCAGCGSKLGPALLRDTLDGLPKAERPGLEPALGRAEDASQWQPTPGRIQVQSIDGFRSFSDDLYRFGRVCVHHALSDLYAMGADPVSAQVWVNLAHHHPRLQKRDYQRLMTGIAEALHEQNVGLAGGHSTEGREAHVALVANGELDPDSAWRKSGARLGDVLVLTKPLGTGVILAADMAAEASVRSVDSAWDSMLTGNDAAARALHSIRPHAVTDVTGFGLLGHLLEMLAGTGLQARIEAGAVPALDGALALIRAGWQSTLYPQLEPYKLKCAIRESVADERIRLMLDPQTSGGLLIALPGENWARIQDQIPDAVVIGQLQTRPENAKAVMVF